MIYNHLPRYKLIKFVEQALEEDINHGDITTNLLIPETLKVQATIKAKSDCVIAGLPFAEIVYSLLDPSIHILKHVNEGDYIHKETHIATITGSAKTILTGERVALNYLQKASGIATYTHQFIQQMQGNPTKLTDTRKTTPGARYLEKYAVTVGGASPHRYSLSDSVLIKDNHIALAGNIFNAVTQVKKYLSHTTKIEVEVENLSQVNEAVKAGVHIIMLDNMSLDEMKKALEVIPRSIITEISGNVTLNRVKILAALGADYISTSAIIFQAPATDISLEVHGTD